MSRPLPQPVTVTDELLVAVHGRLGEILDRLPPKPPEERPGGTVELREPAPPAPPEVAAEPKGAAKTPARRPAARKNTTARTGTGGKASR